MSTAAHEQTQVAARPGRLSRITLCGADDSVEPQALLELAERYPQAEFALLLGQAPGAGGATSAWLEQVAAVFAGRPEQVALHLCGPMAAEAFAGAWPQQIPAALAALARRWQLNTAGVATAYLPGRLLLALAERTAAGQQVIFQYDLANTAALLKAARAGMNVAALFDLSRGADRAPAAWQRPCHPGSGAPLPVPCGYAGGLSEKNLAEQIPRIAAVAGQDFWISATGSLRRQGRFCLQRAEALLKAAEAAGGRPWRC